MAGDRRKSTIAPSPSIRRRSIQTQWTSRDRQLASRACKAVELLGFSKDVTEGVLRSLLGAYDNRWEFIMANNYRVLVEALLDQSVEPATAETAPSASLRGPSIPTQGMSRDRQLVSRACKAVETMGFSKDVTEGVLRSLLGSYENSWELIVADNYRVLVEALLDQSVEPATAETAPSPSLRQRLPALRIYDSPEQKRQRRELDGTPRQHTEKGKGKLVDPTPHKPAKPEVPGASSSQPPQGSGRLDTPLNEVPPATVPLGPPLATASTARVGDEDCCADCYGDAPIPCVCARETGAEFAYTQDGLVKKKFLDECICAAQYPRHDGIFYCKSCPLERSKNEVMPDPCKGHTLRKFIKECWGKCGCNERCGNRVVQRGITCNLQVFHTDDGKGFGVRTLDDLPRGAFVCEYVGEVLTKMELYDGNLKAGNAMHTYPVLLDADWGSEGLLNDEDALCIDATFCGNVATFVNHRCNDANLIEIPVEIETPDRHYNHLAFFTTRKVEAFEELTWDYGIDFDDHTRPVKSFHCRCGSQYCRYVKSQKPRARKLQRRGR